MKTNEKSKKKETRKELEIRLKKAEERLAEYEQEMEELCKAFTLEDKELDKSI